MTTTTRTNLNDQPRKTLASQLDRLDGILDGLDTALAGAVQEAVEQAVKQAVQAVLTEVLTNRQLQQAAQPAPLPEPPRGKQSMLNRLWRVTTECLRRTAQTINKLSRGVGMALLATGGVAAGVGYAARKLIASVVTAVYRYGRRLLSGAVSSLISFLPSFAFGG